MVLLVLFWGLAFVAIKQALAYMSWITLTFLRFAVADVHFVGCLLVTGQIRNPPARNDVPMLVIMAFFGFTGYHLFLNLGEADPNVTAGTAALIIASAPAFIAIFAVPLLKERVGRLPSVGIAVAFAGLAVMILFTRPESAFQFRASEGAIAVLPPVVFSALYAVLGKSYLRRYPPFTFVAWTLLLGTLLLVPLLIATGPGFLADLGKLGLSAWVPALYLGILLTFIVYGIWFRALARLRTASAGAYIFVSTVVAAAGGVAILGEPITLAMIGGGGMVIAGVGLAQQLHKRDA